MVGEGQAIAARRARVPTGEREATIVASAIRVVAVQGFDISVRNLAARIGVPHSILFRYFPTKAALWKRIYSDVFLSRLRAEWPILLTDESVPIAERLLAFYRAYAATVFEDAWVRIFLLAGLKGTSLNADYFDILKTWVLEPICAAVRRDIEPANTWDGPPTAAEMERAWGLHGRIFYLAIRRHVYRRTVPDSLDGVLHDAIAAFLAEARRVGAPAAPDRDTSVTEIACVESQRRRMSPEARRRSIIVGAVAFFAQHGINGQMRELARHLGIAHPLLFHYFPRKQDLVEQVYVEVFDRPWHTVEALLLADGRPLADRLTAFYRAYLAIVDRDEWIRTFISAGLHDAGLCERYLDLVESRVIDVVVEASRHAIGAPDRCDLREDVWGLHGQIVYSAIRNHVYNMPTLLSRQTTVQVAVATFLAALEIKRLSINQTTSPGAGAWTQARGTAARKTAAPSDAAQPST